MAVIIFIAGDSAHVLIILFVKHYGDACVVYRYTSGVFIVPYTLINKTHTHIPVMDELGLVMNVLAELNRGKLYGYAWTDVSFAAWGALSIFAYRWAYTSFSELGVLLKETKTLSHMLSTSATTTTMSTLPYIVAVRGGGNSNDADTPEAVFDDGYGSDISVT